MRKVSIPTLFLVLGALAIAIPTRPVRAQIEASVSIGGFYDELAPYGRWVDCDYGQCWVPTRVASNWQPYTNGQWVYTEYGWTWVSDDPWGGSPYHYGTWTSLDSYGWCWIPGTVWAPAWVTWSYSNNYVGWAPLPPTVVFGASGYGGSAIIVSSSQYVFVPTNRFVGVNVASVRVSTQQNATIFRQTTPVTRFQVSGGYVRNTAIPMETIQRATGARIETRNIRDARVTPHSMAAMNSGQSRQMAVVAPAREVRAAVTNRPQAASRSVAPSGQGQRPSQVRQESGRVPQAQQESPRGTANPGHQDPDAAKAHASSPAHGNGYARPLDSHAQTPPPPSESRHEVAPVHAGQPPPPRPGAKVNKKQPEKDKKVAKDDKDEKR